AGPPRRVLVVAVVAAPTLRAEGIRPTAAGGVEASNLAHVEDVVPTGVVRLQQLAELPPLPLPPHALRSERRCHLPPRTRFTRRCRRATLFAARRRCTTPFDTVRM